MNKQICDFCGKEIKIDRVYKIVISSKNLEKNETYEDVCSDCMTRIGNAFKTIKTTKQPMKIGSKVLNAIEYIGKSI